MWGQLEKLTYGSARWLCLFGLAALLALAFAIVLDVLLRWLFNSPITGVRDAASLFVAVVIASSLPICIAERRHITIRFLGKLLKSRWDAAFETFGNLATLVIFALMAWQLWLYADYLAAEKETTMVLGWPVSPWWRGVSIIVAFCVPVQVIVFLQSIKLALFGGSVSVIEDYNKPEGVKR